MHNIPFDASRIRRFEDHTHSMVHVFLWMCCPTGVDFDSGSKNQIGVLDIMIITRNFRHYLEFKAKKGDSATEAVQQITDKHYNLTFPRSESLQQKPAFHYSIKWMDKSTHAEVEVRAEGAAVDTDLWKNRLSVGIPITKERQWYFLLINVKYNLFPAEHQCPNPSRTCPSMKIGTLFRQRAQSP